MKPSLSNIMQYNGYTCNPCVCRTSEPIVWYVELYTCVLSNSQKNEIAKCTKVVRILVYTFNGWKSWGIPVSARCRIITVINALLYPYPPLHLVRLFTHRECVYSSLWGCVQYNAYNAYNIHYNVHDIIQCATRSVRAMHRAAPDPDGAARYPTYRTIP